jgi:short-subunit dehydrogenase
MLGSTSLVGEAIIEEFSKDNRIILSGRNDARLTEVSNRCMRAGALDVKIVVADLSETIQPIVNANFEWPIDLLIDAASAASINRDSEVKPETIIQIIQADVIAHMELLKIISENNARHPNVIFISTILTRIKTPDREIYSMAKRIMEIYLQKIAKTKPNVKILIFHIAKIIDTKHDRLKAKTMAKSLYLSSLEGGSTIIYGLLGRILILLSLLHPKILDVIIIAHRKFRGSN